MSELPEIEVRIESLRDGGFIVFRGRHSVGEWYQPAKAVSTLGEALHFVAEIMGPNPGGSGQNRADANSKKDHP